MTILITLDCLSHYPLSSGSRNLLGKVTQYYAHRSHQTLYWFCMILFYKVSIWSTNCAWPTVLIYDWWINIFEKHLKMLRSSSTMVLSLSYRLCNCFIYIYIYIYISYIQIQPNSIQSVFSYYTKYQLLLFPGWHDDDVTCTSCSLKSPATPLFVLQLMRTHTKETSNCALLALCERGIHRWPVNSPQKDPVTRKKRPFDDVIMT